MNIQKQNICNYSVFLIQTRLALELEMTDWAYLWQQKKNQPNNTFWIHK